MDADTNVTMQSTTMILGLPDSFTATLLILALILLLAPYLSGMDFGVLKIPKFPENQNRRLKRFGPLLFFLVLLLFIPLWPTDESSDQSPARKGAPSPGLAQAQEQQSPDPVADGTEAIEKSKTHDLYQEACEGGEVKGCARLGVLYERGHGVEKNYSEAAKYYEIACNRLDATSCFNLGSLYERGLGVREDLIRAHELYVTACDSGEPDACKRQNLVGVIIRNAQPRSDATDDAEQKREKDSKSMSDRGVRSAPADSSPNRPAQTQPRESPPVVEPTPAAGEMDTAREAIRPPVPAVAEVPCLPDAEYYFQTFWSRDICSTVRYAEELRVGGCEAQVWEKSSDGELGYAVTVGGYQSHSAAEVDKVMWLGKCGISDLTLHLQRIHGSMLLCPGHFFVQTYALSTFETAVREAEVLHERVRNVYGELDSKTEVYDRAGMFAVVITAQSGVEACAIRDRAIADGILKDKPRVTYRSLYGDKRYPL